MFPEFYGGGLPATYKPLRHRQSQLVVQDTPAGRFDVVVELLFRTLLVTDHSSLVVVVFHTVKNVPLPPPVELRILYSISPFFRADPTLVEIDSLGHSLTYTKKGTNLFCTDKTNGPEAVSGAICRYM